MDTKRRKTKRQITKLRITKSRITKRRITKCRCYKMVNDINHHMLQNVEMIKVKTTKFRIFKNVKLSNC